MTHLRQAFREEADADERVAIAIGHRNYARAVMRVALRAERERQGLSLRALARRIECSAAHLSDIETGKRWSAAYVYLACEVLGCLPTSKGAR